MILIEELALSVIREREEETRRMQAGLLARQARRESREPLRSRLARALVRLGARLDPAAARTSGGSSPAKAS